MVFGGQDIRYPYESVEILRRQSNGAYYFEYGPKLNVRRFHFAVAHKDLIVNPRFNHLFFDDEMKGGKNSQGEPTRMKKKRRVDVIFAIGGESPDVLPTEEQDQFKTEHTNIGEMLVSHTLGDFTSAKWHIIPPLTKARSWFACDILR